MDLDCIVTSSRLNDTRLEGARLHREEYAFVGSGDLLSQAPLSRSEHAKKHTLLDVSSELPLFRYWREAPGGDESMVFQRVITLGSGDAIRQRVLQGAGVAVLPVYLIQREVKEGMVKRILPEIKPLSDFFRLVYRTGDARQSVLKEIAESMRGVPLK